MRQPHIANKRSRGRGGGRRPQNPRNQLFDSNGPGIRIRGNAVQVFEKYQQLARDASSSGDRVGAENLFQHAEHYYRLHQAAHAALAGNGLDRQAHGHPQPRPGQPVPQAPVAAPVAAPAPAASPPVPPAPPASAAAGGETPDAAPGAAVPAPAAPPAAAAPAASRAAGGNRRRAAPAAAAPEPAAGDVPAGGGAAPA